MEFKGFKLLIQNHFAQMTKDAHMLFRTDVDKDSIWETYLDSFPAGTNGIFRKRREHDCSACRHFIKDIGNVVAIKNNVVHSIWELDCEDSTYGPVCKAMDSLVKSKPIVDVYFSQSKRVGIDKNHEVLEDGRVLTWEHFCLDLPNQFVLQSDIGNVLNEKRTGKSVFKRSLEEFSVETVETVIELICQGSLYRGEEWKNSLIAFLQYKKDYDRTPDDQKDNFAWENFDMAGPVVGRIRNHSIGTLLIDIENGMPLDEAVTRYEKVVAPSNYKRPKAIFTKKMLEDAKKTVQELGFMDSLPRRFATLEDVTVNNILFVNRDAAQRMAGANVFDDMEEECTVNPKKFNRATQITVDDFVKNVLPTASSVEVLLENRHTKNMVSLIAPVNVGAPSMFKWGNPFSWAYSGNIADSDIRKNVKSAGGKIDGVLRFSIQWNDRDEFDGNDLDAHCQMPTWSHIFFGCKTDYTSGGNLDVDIISPKRGKPAVENITWPTIIKMPNGNYRFYVQCYSNNGGKSGFRAEIEFNGNVYQYDYNKPLRQNEIVDVAVVKKTGDMFDIQHKMPHDTSNAEVWGVKTNQFIPVSTIMYSPNYWDDKDGIGNKHYFFMLKGCVNPEHPNGFFNEYLKQELVQHKRVFEALGSKLAVEDAVDQLSGVGFSSTQRNNMIVRVKGRVDRVMNVLF